ncbi:MAG: hypothetical protein IJ711_03900 [Lachnospiraceae bacterium]|nr:hypothetical protein [Lachnospiraceae bacterium]
MDMDKILNISLIIGEIIVFTEEYVSAIFNYSASNRTKATIIDFVSTTDVIQQGLFENRYFSLVEVTGIQYIIRRSVKDKIGREITICRSKNSDRVLKSLIAYRTGFEILYHDFMQVLWHITAISFILIWVQKQF